LIVTGKLEVAPKAFYATLGGLTYPLYLIHSTAGKAMIDTITPHLSEALAVTLTIVVMLAISYLIHVGIEQKISTPLKQLIFSMINRFSPSTAQPSRQLL